MDEIEKVARAICEADGWADPDNHVIGGQAQAFEDYGPRWKAVSNGYLGDPDYVKLATAAITAYRAALGDKGMVVVPRVPTEAMCNAGFPYIHARKCYRAMIAAAPKGDKG